MTPCPPCPPCCQPIRTPRLRAVRSITHGLARWLLALLFPIDLRVIAPELILLGERHNRVEAP